MDVTVYERHYARLDTLVNRKLDVDLGLLVSAGGVLCLHVCLHCYNHNVDLLGKKKENITVYKPLMWLSASLRSSFSVILSVRKRLIHTSYIMVCCFTLPTAHTVHQLYPRYHFMQSYGNLA